MAQTIIFHMCKRDEWNAALGVGDYAGSSQDTADGFIHFSSAEQVSESARKHRHGQRNLVLLWVNADVLDDALKWETSRNGMLFPHLFGPLPTAAVIRVDDLPLGADGNHIFPPDMP